MSNSNQDVLNTIIKEILPNVNSEIQGVIKSNRLDPWGQIANGVQTLGTINFGICQARAEAHYIIVNMTGLSSFHIDQLQITATHQGANANELVGTVHMTASLTSNLSAHINGGLEAQCNIIHKSTVINGSANVNATKAVAVGSFSASVDGGNVCLNSITISPAMINFENIEVHLAELGIFNEFLGPLTNLILALFRGRVREAISGAMTPILNKELASVMPQCKSVS